MTDKRKTVIDRQEVTFSEDKVPAAAAVIWEGGVLPGWAA
jgi:hypothetical protein